MELTDAQKRIAAKYKPGQTLARAVEAPKQSAANNNTTPQQNTVGQMQKTGNAAVDRSLGTAKVAEHNAIATTDNLNNLNTRTKQRQTELQTAEEKMKAAEAAYKNSPTLVNQLIYENAKKQYDNAYVLYSHTADRAATAYDVAIGSEKRYQTAVENFNKTVDAENQKVIDEQRKYTGRIQQLQERVQNAQDQSNDAVEERKNRAKRLQLISQERFRNDRSLSELYALYEGDYDAYTRGELPMGSGVEQLKKDWEAFLASPDANDPAAIEAWEQKLKEAYAAAANPYDYIANRNFERNAAIDPDRKDPKLARMQNEWDTLEYLKNDAASRAEQAKAAKWEREQEQSILDAGGEELLNNLLELDKVMKRIHADGAAGKTYSADIAEWERLEKLIAPYAGTQLSGWKEFAARRNNEQRYTDAQQRIAALTQKTPGIMNLARVPASLTSGIGMLDAGVQKLERILTGSETPVDYKSAAQLPGMVSETVRDTTTGMIEEATKDKAAGNTAFGNLYAQAYQLGTSMLDSAAIVGLSLMGVPGGTLLLGGSAGNQAMLNAKERGADDWQALGVGVLAGAAEAMFEQVGIDNLTKNMKDATRMRHILRSAVKQAIPEATEEGLTTIANLISDRLIMGGLSEYETSIRKYMARGMSREDAARQVNRETAITLATDVIGGAISGGFFGAVGGTGNVIRQNLYNRYEGRMISRAGDETLKALLNAAGERGKNTESYKLAMKIGDRLTKGKRPSDLDVGRLQNALAQDVIREAEQRAVQPQTQTEEEPIVYPTPKLPYVDNTKTTTEENGDEPVVHPPLKLAGPEQAGTFEDPAASALSPEQRQKYNAAGTETERTGILYGATQEQIDMALRLSDFTGREVLFYNREITPKRAEHGNTLNNTIYINTASGNPMAQIFAHELTHTIESANAYKGLSSAVFARMQQLGRNVDAEREKVMDMYRKADVELTEEGANQELVAKFIESNLLTDEASIYDLVQRNPTLGRRFLNWIDSVLARLGSKNARERQFLERAKSLYVSALRETDGLDQASRFGMARNRLQDDLTAGRLTEQEFDEAMDALSDTRSMEGEGLLEQFSIGESTGELNEDARKALELERGRQYSIGETETAEGTEEQAQSAVDTLPGKAKSYLEKAERTLTNSLTNALGVPWYAKREFLRPVVREISEEYLKTGRVTQKTANRLFETAYKNGMAANQEFYDQSRELKDRLREQKLAVSDEVAAELPNYDMFRKFASKTLRIVSEGGMDVGQFYEQLTQEYPDIFPADITSSVEQLQRMYNVGQDIRKAEKALQEKAGPDAAVFKEWNKNDFQNAIGDILQELQKVKRYADSKAEQETKAKTLESVEQVKELYPKIKEARDAVDKIVAKTLLTDEDNMTVGRLLRGEILPEHVEADNENAKNILAVYEAKKAFEELAAPVREWNRRRKAQLREEADRYLQTAIDWKDKRWGLGYSMETMERNIRDIVSDPILAEQIIKKYFTPVHEGAAAANTLKNVYRDEVREMGISRKVDKRAGNEVSEAAAVQIYGEAMDNIRMIEESKGRVKIRDGHTLDEWRAIVTDLWKNNPGLDQAKIERAVEGFRKIYDELFEQMNEARIRNGYEPINYRKGYFPHFQAGDDNGGLLGVFGKAFGISMDVTALPTTINGLTHTFKPGIQWFGHAQERTGFQTAFDAVEGFDKYIEGVADVITMTDQLQRLRALASQIRYRTTSEEIRKRVDKIKQDNTKTDQEKETLIEKEYGEGPYSLSKFVVNLEEYINLLANKKSKFDRMMEENLSRNAYNVVKALESRVAANMVAINPASWLTNFIPLTQAKAVLDRGALLHGMWDTLKNIKENDGFVDRSVFLTNRRGSDPLVRTWAQQTSAVLSKPMEWIDSLTADTIVRARYWQNMKHGMSEAAAMEDADAFAASVMADRSKGSMPTIFNRSNPVAKVFTQFQLEVNNQFRYLFKDVPRETRDKGLEMLAAALFKFFLGAWLYNEVYEFFIGRRPALDPIGILTDTVGDFTGYELPNIVGMGWDLIRGEPISFETEQQGTYQSMANLGKNVAEEVPFIGGLLGGGRVPISSALPNVENLAKAAFNDEWSGRKRLLTAGKEFLNPATYLLLPFGGGQAKKILQTAKAIRKDGVYTADAEGNDILQYPVHTDNGWLLAGTVIQGGLFGPTTLEGGREWVESGFKNLSARETAAYQAMLEAGVDSRDAYDLIKAMKAEKNDDAKAELLKNAEISEAGKFALYYSVLATDREKNLLDQLSSSDADEFEATNVLMELEDAKGIPGTAGSQAERNVILSSKLSDEAKAKVFYTMTASESNKTLMDEMEDRGADFGQVAKAVMDIANTGTLYGAEKSNAKRNAIMQAELTDEEKKFLYRATFGEHYWDGSGERYYSSRDDEIAAFEEAGMSFDQFLQAQNAYSIINEEYHGAAEKATEFSKWVDQQGYKKEQAEVVKNSFKFYAQIAQSATKYETFTGAGLSAEKAYDLTGVLNALQPEAGKETVSTAQKVIAIQNHKGLSASEKINAIAGISTSRVQQLTAAGLKQETANKVAAALAVEEAENGEETLSAVDKARIVIDNTSGREETLKGLEAVLTESTYYKVEAAATYGSSAKDWVAFKEQYERKFGNKNASMERVEEILDAMNISVQSKAALWQICNKSWKPKNNPYNPLIGGKVQQELEKYSKE